MVIPMSRTLCTVSLVSTFVSIRSTIFMAGNAMKTSMTTEKTRVITISIILESVVTMQEVLFCFILQREGREGRAVVVHDGHGLTLTFHMFLCPAFLKI